MATTPAQTDAEDFSRLPYEAAAQRLEDIVERMESGDIPLAELLQRYEEGSRLLGVCENHLKAAELKIEQLKRRKDGSLTTEPFTLAEPNLG